MKIQTGSKLGKEFIKVAYCHLVYLTYMQSTACEMLDWMKYKLGSRCPGEISIPQVCRDITLMVESEENLKRLLMKVKKESKKVGLKFNI